MKEKLHNIKELKGRVILKFIIYVAMYIVLAMLLDGIILYFTR